MTNPLTTPALIALLLLVGVDAQARVSPGHTQDGVASYYHDRFHGRKTASGAAYNKNALSAAHKSLPLGTEVRVTDARSGKSVIVKINDRGPYAKGRVIDLSRAAAREIGLTKKGLAKVKVEVLKMPQKGRRDS
jgi:rare lipoprotein A